jgi:uncharacterized damage-inducible protein DinB
MNEIDLYALHRLARAAADAGHYNPRKLLNAAAVSLVNRSLYTADLPKTDRGLADAVAAIEPQLGAAGIDRDLLAALRRARTLVQDSQLIPVQDAPPVFVCRVCGEVALSAAPERCPQCGAGQLVFQFFPAAFYLEPEPVATVMAQLGRTPDWLEAMLRGLSDEQASRSVDGTEGAWSLREAAGHLLDTQELIAHRVNLFLEEASPNLNAKAMWQTVESAKLSSEEIGTLFRHSRESMLSRLRTIPAEYWTHVGQHSEFGPVTLQQQCTYFAKHEQWHMAQMTHIRRSL